MQKLSSALLVGMIVLSSQTFLKQNCGTRPDVRRSVINFNVDDIFKHFYVNDNEIKHNVPNDELRKWDATHTIAVNLYPGDTIKIEGENIQGEKSIVGTLQYYLPSGELRLIHTGEGWKCNGAPAVVQERNDGNKWPYYSCVDSSAKHIWSKPEDSTTSCTYTIPAQ